MPFDLLNPSCPIVGMLHLAPLAGAPRHGGSLALVREHMLADARALVDGGIGALMMENFGDAPFYPGRVPAHVVAQMAVLATEVRRRFDVPLGINVLRNDGLSALAIAQAAGASFIRVNVLCGARITDQGLIQGIAHDLARERVALGALGVAILADVNVKHSVPIGLQPVEDEVSDTLERGAADMVIVSGTGTGKAVDLDELAKVKSAAGARPVLVGSGTTASTIASLGRFADGFIVGTSLKKDGIATNPVDPKRVRELVAAFRAR